MEIGPIARPPAALVEAFAAIPTGTVSNALDRLRLSGAILGIGPVAPGLRLCGPAFTVAEVSGELGAFPPEDLALGAMIDGAAAGDVVVVDNGGRPVSTWGGVASHAARARGIAGLVVDGGVRDAAEIARLGFAAFARHVVPVTGKGRIRVLGCNLPVRIAGIAVRPGDIVLGDETGVVSVPAERAAEVLDLAREQDAADARIVELVDRGLSFTEASRRANVH